MSSLEVIVPPPRDVSLCRALVVLVVLQTPGGSTRFYWNGLRNGARHPARTQENQAPKASSGSAGTGPVSARNSLRSPV